MRVSMRFLPFAALYAGILVSGTLALPVPSEYEWAPRPVHEFSRFPRCLRVDRLPGTGWVRVEGLVDLGERLRPAVRPGVYEGESELGDFHWTASRGDSLDLFGHHTMILRLPVFGGDTLVGRAYPPSYANIYDALLAQPMAVSAVRVECPRSGGGISR